MRVARPLHFPSAAVGSRLRTSFASSRAFHPPTKIPLTEGLTQGMNSLRPILAALAIACSAAGFASEPTPQDLAKEAVTLFFDAKPAASARVFDQLVIAAPKVEPELWQRGLSLYYAERYADGQKQFELHRTVNPNDVENVAWHFLCLAKLKGREAAREALLPVGDDPRVPMKQILAFYAGKAEPADVLAAAEKGDGQTRRNQLCYAHLYLGLYFEALGDDAKARDHITQAAGPHRMDHYMGNVAVMHAKLRGWPVDDPAQAP